jgi:hypothetical protein
LARITGRALPNRHPYLVGRWRAVYRHAREVRAMSITCELQDLDELMAKAGVLLTGNAYDRAQDFLQDNCACATYKYLIERGRASD